MLDIEFHIQKVLDIVPIIEQKTGSALDFEKSLEEMLYVDGGASWDIPDKKINRPLHPDK